MIVGRLRRLIRSAYNWDEQPGLDKGWQDLPAVVKQLHHVTESLQNNRAFSIVGSVPDALSSFGVLISWLFSALDCEGPHRRRVSWRESDSRESTWKSAAASI